MATKIAALPVVRASTFCRVCIEMGKRREENLEEYFEEQLARIREENPALGKLFDATRSAVNEDFKEEYGEDCAKEMGDALIYGGVMVYRLLERQSAFESRKRVLRGKQVVRFFQEKNQNLL